MLLLHSDKLLNVPYTNDIMVGKVFDPLIPRKPLSDAMESLVNEYGIEEVISCFKAEDLIRCKRIKWIIDKRIKSGLERRGDNHKLNYVMGYGILVSLVHEKVLAALARAPDNPLKALPGIQLHCLLCAWTHSIISEGVFNTKNIIQYGKHHYHQMNDALCKLSDNGYLEALTADQIYKKTKKFSKNKNPRYKFMRITRIGEKLLKNYFELYSTKHFEFTGEYWNIQLETIDKFKDYEK